MQFSETTSIGLANQDVVLWLHSGVVSLLVTVEALVQFADLAIVERWEQVESGGVHFLKLLVRVFVGFEIWVTQV